jgi:hypothetical protein
MSKAAAARLGENLSPLLSKLKLEASHIDSRARAEVFLLRIAIDCPSGVEEALDDWLSRAARKSEHPA